MLLVRRRDRLELSKSATISSHQELPVADQVRPRQAPFKCRRNASVLVQPLAGAALLLDVGVGLRRIFLGPRQFDIIGSQTSSWEMSG